MRLHVQAVLLCSALRVTAKQPLLPELRLIPAGSTAIGTSGDRPITGAAALAGRPFGDFDERPALRDVAVQSFRIGTTEVTNAQFEQFDPSHRLLRGFEHGFSMGDDEPAVFVSYTNATRYCDWLSEHDPMQNGVAQRYRLPTEVEWEYSARAGSTTNFFWGDNWSAEHANIPGNTCPSKCPNLTVARFPPNKFGLYDTVGNVEEWTSSAYAPFPGADPSSFSPGLVVTRGGGHSNDPSVFYLRSANRGAAMEHERSSVIGFRVASSAADIRDMASASADFHAPVPAFETARNEVAMATLPSVRSVPASSETPQMAVAAGPVFHGPFEYTRFSSSITEDSGGPIFQQHNHAPAMGILPGGKALILSWFSTITENGREPVYAYSTLDVASMGSNSGGDSTAGDVWANASVLWKAADRGQQTQAFHSSDDGQTLSWYACVAPAAGYISAAIVRRDMDMKTRRWGEARYVTMTTDKPAHAKGGSNATAIEHVPLHANGHIPFERVVELPGNTTLSPILAMPATYLGVVSRYCVGCASGASSVVLISRDNGLSWKPPGPAAYMSGISQFVVLKNGSLLALGRGGSNFPTSACPWLTRSISHNHGLTWEHSWYKGLWPLGGGKRHVFFRLREGPLLLISFTGGSNVTTVSGRTRRFSGLYAATSTDEGASFQIHKPLVNEAWPPTQLNAMDKIPFTMTNATAEPRGYTSARQTADGMIHVATSRNSYHFNLEWLLVPPLDAPDSPPPGSGPLPPAPAGRPIPAGTWFTRRADWEMHSPTAKRTIKARVATRVCSDAACSSGGNDTVIAVHEGWSFVLLAPPTSDSHNLTWALQCPCKRYA
jgi:sulfatase modifying factor 1